MIFVGSAGAFSDMPRSVSDRETLKVSVDSLIETGKSSNLGRPEPNQSDRIRRRKLTDVLGLNQLKQIAI